MNRDSCFFRLLWFFKRGTKKTNDACHTNFVIDLPHRGVSVALCTTDLAYYSLT